jgi:hypothetical protein
VCVQGLTLKVKFCTISLQIFMYIFLTSVKFSGTLMIRQMPMTCSALGFLIQLTYLSAFFLINAISFDIWYTFEPLRTFVGVLGSIQLILNTFFKPTTSLCNSHVTPWLTLSPMCQLETLSRPSPPPLHKVSNTISLAS